MSYVLPMKSEVTVSSVEQIKIFTVTTDLLDLKNLGTGFPEQGRFAFI